MLKFVHKFPEVVFLGVTMESLQGDEEVWLARLEYHLKRAITFGPTVGSRLNIYRSFLKLFSLA
jgi:hypothetical protein